MLAAHECWRCPKSDGLLTPAGCTAPELAASSCGDPVPVGLADFGFEFAFDAADGAQEITLAVTAFTADAGCAAADLVGGAGCSIVVPAALASATAVGFESATQGAAAVTASVSHASVTRSVRPPIRLTSPQTVLTGLPLNVLVSTTVTINNFPASAPVSVWVDGIDISGLVVSATDVFAALTTAICPTTLTSNHFNGSANACFGVLPSRFVPPSDLNLAFVPQANDRSGTLHIGGASITFFFNPALRLEAPGGTDRPT